MHRRLGASVVARVELKRGRTWKSLGVHDQTAAFASMTVE
jgi:hypothetical protein